MMPNIKSIKADRPKAKLHATIKAESMDKLESMSKKQKVNLSQITDAVIEEGLKHFK